MNVSNAVATRRSIRAFLDKPVDDALLRGVIEKALRAPSNSNIQPWHVHVVSGAARDRLCAATAARSTIPPSWDQPQIKIYPEPMTEPYESRRFHCGERQYAALGIAREDLPGRLRYVYNNLQFFGAPVGLFIFIDRRCGESQWADLGIFLQTLMLLLVEAGLDSCAQISWGMFRETVRRELDIPDDQLLYCGLSIGYADPSAAVNEVRADRAPLEEVVTFHNT